MKKRFLKRMRALISKQYPDYSNDKLDEIIITTRNSAVIDNNDISIEKDQD